MNTLINPAVVYCSASYIKKIDRKASDFSVRGLALNEHACLSFWPKKALIGQVRDTKRESIALAAISLHFYYLCL